ncbi:MAG TPA: 16S rRNA (cytosine(1402)-N(4))-methyltransferase RsmH, partial [Anseongella sp.]|nr:16S rRNA (cytosine(1402)-N(4))-methyltransferase RsmH [Anseongella sp.]
MEARYHNPVLLDESMEGLNINPAGIYIDVTFGGGGHSREILKRLGEKGRLIAFDQDEDAAANVPRDERFTFVPQNFRYLKKYCRLYGAVPAHGILADLGVSSHQLDSPARGFSTRHNAGLDMRMDRQLETSARDVLNSYPEEALHRIFGMYGEVPNARTLARNIVHARVGKPLVTVEELKEVLAPLARRGSENKYYAQVFQALRIEVNEEMEALRELLLQSQDVLKKDGRLVVISYHSLEDRLVKNFINKGRFSGEVEKDLYGNEIKPFEAVNKKPLRPGASEIASNSRARS